MQSRIIFNGGEYASPDDMPADVRRAYAAALAALPDQDRNGIPDVLERGPSGDTSSLPRTTITVNGKTYENVDALAPAVRQIYDGVMRGLDANQNGIPDPFETGPRPEHSRVPTVGTVHRNVVIGVSDPRSATPPRDAGWRTLALSAAVLIGALLLLVSLSR